MKDATWLKTYKIAHRGLHTEMFPENSFGAFEHAISHNMAIELDIQPSLEGTPMVFHDVHLKRLTGVDDVVYHQLESDLKNIPLNHTAYKISSLEDTLAFVAGRVPLLIEIKADAPVISLTNAVIECLENYEGKVAVHSFSPKVVRHLKAKAPHLLRGQISSDFKTTEMSFWRKFYLSRMLLNWLTKPDFITYDIRGLPHPSVLKYQASNGIVLGYTAKNKKAYQAALKMVDNVIFEEFLPEV